MPLVASQKAVSVSHAENDQAGLTTFLQSSAADSATTFNPMLRTPARVATFVRVKPKRVGRGPIKGRLAVLASEVRWIGNEGDGRCISGRVIVNAISTIIGQD